VELAVRHGGVHGEAVAREAKALALAGGDDARADRGGGLAGGVGPERAVGDGRDLDVQVDAVEERPRDPRPVLEELVRRAAAGVVGVAQVAAHASPRCLFAMSG